MYFKKKLFARELRKESTIEEVKVWKILRNRKFLNLKFRRQHAIEGFVVDFYCHGLKLAIEIDGDIHNNQKDYDSLRQSLIEEKGFMFIRVSDNEINSDINLLLEKIKSFVN